MKKLIALLLALVMIMSFAACGSAESGAGVIGGADGPTNIIVTDKNEESDETQQEEETLPEAEEPETEKPEVEQEQPEVEGNTSSQPPQTDATIGQTLLDAFTEMANAGTTDPQELADALLTNSVIAFSGGSMAVEHGYLAGFDIEIDGFDQGVVFMPMIGTIPFVGYIFVLDSEDSVPDFTAYLLENCNPRWNICTEADETVVGSVGNIVFFVMCSNQEA